MEWNVIFYANEKTGGDKNTYRVYNCFTETRNYIYVDFIRC